MSEHQASQIGVVARVTAEMLQLLASLSSVPPSWHQGRFRVLKSINISIYLTYFISWGSAEFIGLGFLSFITIIITEIFGSPFLKNISIIVGLAVGCIVAGAAGYIDGSTIKSAPAITFLWYVFLRRCFDASVLKVKIGFTASKFQFTHLPYYPCWLFMVGV